MGKWAAHGTRQNVHASSCLRMPLFKLVFPTAGDAVPVAPSFGWTGFFVYPVILSGAKNLLPGMHAGRSGLPSLVQRGFDATEAIHPTGTWSRSLPALRSSEWPPERVKDHLTFVMC